MLFIHIAADNCFGDDDDENDATDEVLLIGGHQLRYPLPSQILQLTEKFHFQ